MKPAGYSEFKLRGAVCVVTGGARGIGRAIVEKFLDAGAIVHVLDINREAFEEWSHKLPKGTPLTFHKTNITDGRAVAAALRKLPMLDVLVNNAARPFYRPFEKLTRKEWDDAIRNDLHGAFEITHQSISRLKKSKQPSIVTITSIEAMQAEPGTVAYGSSKGALQQFTRSLAVDLGPAGIRVNSVAPGAIIVERNLKIFQQSKWKKHFRARVPLEGRPGEAHEIANTVLFLASPLASYVTGATIVADGGWTCLL